MDALVGFLSQLQTWHWLAFALILLIAEIATGTSYMLWPAAAAGLTGLALMAAPLDWRWQIGAFAALTLALTACGRFYLKNRRAAQSEPALNDRGAAMIGAIALADAPFSAGIGRVRYGDSVWRAASGDEIAAGERVEILGVEGITLNVRKASAPV